MARPTKTRPVKAPKSRAKANRGSMSAPRSGVKVRMYRQGHGDCFLLAFPKADGGPFYVLIDCGYKPGSNEKYGLHKIADIVDSIKQATNRKLDLVVVTHEHQDHVNGFWKANEPYFGEFNIAAAWFAWTEDPSDELANELRKRYHDQLLGLVGARKKLAAAVDGTAVVERMDNLLSLELGIDDPTQFAAAAAAKTKDPDSSVNKQGMKLVKDKAGKKNVSYIRPHQDILHLDGVDGVRVFALGPPHSANLISDEDPQGEEAFPGQGVLGLSVLAALSEESTGVKNGAPFARRFSIPFNQACTDEECGAFFQEHYGCSEDSTEDQTSLQCASNAGWRRIDTDWLYSAEQLALTLNKGINNTSLVLAFELEGSGKVLLFAGDAQRGNWKSWTGGSWKDDKEKEKNKDKEITVRDLLSRTVLYKVGHHGSHNATLKGTVESDYPNLDWMGHGKYADEFTAMITAVKKWAYAVKPTPWRHPLPSIKNALLKKTEGRVFQTDTDSLEKPDHLSDSDWNDFMQRVTIDPDGLYFEYEIHDTLR